MFMPQIRKGLLAIAFGFLLIFGQPLLSYADPASVYDCLQDDLDCFETNEGLDSQNETDSPSTNLESNGSSKSSLGMNIIKMVLSLLFIFLLIYVLSRFLKRKNGFLSETNELERLGGISVGANKSIQIIRVGQSYYMIGVGDNVELLKEITDKQMIETLQQRQQADFKDSIGRFSSLFTKSKDQQGADAPFSKVFSTELQKMQQQRNKLINGMKDEDPR